MKRPPEAEIFAAELKGQLRQLNDRSDLVAVGYLKAIYHVAATYGVHELEEEMKLASSQIYERLRKDDPIRVHYFISVMLSLPSLCDPRWLPDLEATVSRLNLPKISQSFMQCMKSNVESYQKQKEGEPGGTDNSGASPLRV